MDKTVEYLIESASAAVATFNNMEALVFLQEAQELVSDYSGKVLSKSEQIKMESISGEVRSCLQCVQTGRLSSSNLQALLQSGEVEESIPHFQHALRLLRTQLPNRKLSVLISIVFQAIRQLLHVKFPRRFMGRRRYTLSYTTQYCSYLCRTHSCRRENFLELAHCMTQLVHAYQLQNSDIHSFSVALRQLNTVEEAEEDIHEVQLKHTHLLHTT